MIVFEDFFAGAFLARSFCSDFFAKIFSDIFWTGSRFRVSQCAYCCGSCSCLRTTVNNRVNISRGARKTAVLYPRVVIVLVVIHNIILGRNLRCRTLTDPGTFCRKHWMKIKRYPNDWNILCTMVQGWSVRKLHKIVQL